MKVKQDRQYERRKHSSLLVPFSYYKSIIPDLFPFVQMHSHAEWEMNFVTEGSGTLSTERNQYHMKAGDIILLCPHTLHAIESCQRICYDTIVFSSDVFGNKSDRCFSEVIAPLSNASELIYIQTDNRYYQELYDAAYTAVECAKENTARMDLRLKSELMRFVWFAQESGVCRQDGVVAENQEIRQAIQYMNFHYEDAITLEDMAESVNLSKSWFMQKFKATVGVGAMEYLNKLRIQKVCGYILDGMSISEAAFTCGFRNLSNFNRLFKAAVGFTPSEYLKKYRES